MSTHLDPLDITLNDKTRRVWNVAEFAQTMGLNELQERDLHTLFGDFATRQELLANCIRSSRVR